MDQGPTVQMLLMYACHGPAERKRMKKPERKVILEITGDGLTAEELGRIRQAIRHLNYKRGRRKAPRLFYRYNFNREEI